MSDEHKKEVPDGIEKIPTMDFKVLEEMDLETAIAHILKNQEKSQNSI